MNEKPIYLDYAATTPVDPRVLEAMLPYFTEEFGNPSSQHECGKRAMAAIDRASQQIADSLNCLPEEIIYTSGATEAINLAIKGTFEANIGKGNHIITVATEHKAVLDTCEYLETIGAEVTYLGVDSDGLIDLQELETAIKPSTILISVMWVNNETGVIQDVEAISKIAHDHGIPYMCDATQAVGKVPVDIKRSGIDLMVFSGHKIYGPKGIGALIKKRDLKIAPQIHGGGQQQKLRSGTFNVPGIVGLGVAIIINLLSEELPLKFNTSNIKLKLNKDFNAIQVSLKKSIPLIEIYKCSRINLQILKKSFLFSQGSACQSSLLEESHVIKAMGLKDTNNEFIRISYSKILNVKG